MMDNDARYMQRALELAQQAQALGEVPVGAVITFNDEIIAEGYNQPITGCDPTAHAEIVALRHAAKHLGNYRLVDCSLYVTLEPCAMCAGAMVHARIKRLIYATNDPRTGAAGSVFNLVHHPELNHRIECHSGVLAEASSMLLKSFFRGRRS